MTRVALKILSKPIRKHYCPHNAIEELLHWKPVEMLTLVYPETHRYVGHLKPAVAAYCPRCGELYTTVEK